MHAKHFLVAVLVAAIFALPTVGLAQDDILIPGDNLAQDEASLSSSSSASNAPRFNLRFNPLGFLVGSFSGDLDIRVSNKLTVGPRLGIQRFSVKGTSFSSNLFGVRGNIYMGGDVFSESWYIGPSYTLSKASVKRGTSEGTLSASTLAVLFGYQWVWSNSFNMNFGGGVQHKVVPSSVKADDGSRINTHVFAGTLPTFELTFGFIF